MKGVNMSDTECIEMLEDIYNRRSSNKAYFVSKYKETRK